MQHDPDPAEAQAAFRRGDLARARVIAEARLAAEPGLAVLQHLVGLIDCREGRLDAGVERLRNAVEGEPDNAAYRVMLVRALNDSGRHEEALAVADPPAGTSPPELALWHARAEAAQALGRHSDAAEAWKILSSARPDDWRAWANYGDALAGLDRWPEATDALRRAWTLNPGERPLQRNLATALARAGFFGEAADRLKAMLDAGPEDTGTRLMLARLLADLGRNEEAVKELGEVARGVVGEKMRLDDAGLIRIALGDLKEDEPVTQSQLRSVRELAMLLERTNQIENLRALVEQARNLGFPAEDLAYPEASIALRDGDAKQALYLLRLENPDRDPMRRHALVAKAADRLGDVEGAFAAAEAMHRATPDFDSWRARGLSYRRRQRSLARTITPEWIGQLQPLPPGMRRAPAFLVGFPRSGTTLLDTFLMGHPDIQMLEEFQMLGAAGAAIGNIADLPHRSPADLERARTAYFAELDRHVDTNSGGLIIDKLPLNMLGLPLIRALFPDAPVIFAQRHPCDVVLSGFMQSFVMNDAMACFLDLADAADFYDTALELWTKSREALPDRIHVSVYEELVADPEASLRPLIEFLGLEWRPELLDHRATARSRGAISTPSYDQVVQPLSKAPSGRWRRYETQLEPVLPVLLPWAQRLGYTNEPGQIPNKWR